MKNRIRNTVLTTVILVTGFQGFAQNDQSELSNAIIGNYLELKNALVETDEKGAKQGALDLIKSIGNSSDDLLDLVLIDAKNIANSEDIKMQRSYLPALSDNIYAWIKDEGDYNGTLYRQFCPMARKSKGAYWLASEEEVNNPYYGDMMLHCGVVKEIIE